MIVAVILAAVALVLLSVVVWEATRPLRRVRWARSMYRKALHERHLRAT